MRHSVRVLLFDQELSAVLLFENHGVPDESPWWITVGGGVKPGEDKLSAAIREVFEETGLVRDRQYFADRHIGSRQVDHVYRDHVSPQFEDYFYMAVEPGESLTFQHFTQAEVRVITGERWWAREELAAPGAQTVWPENLLDFWEWAMAAAAGKACSLVQITSSQDRVPSLRMA